VGFDSRAPVRALTSEYPRTLLGVTSMDSKIKAAVDRLLGRGAKPTRSDVDTIYFACQVAIPLPPCGPQLDVAKALAELLELRQQIKES